MKWTDACMLDDAGIRAEGQSVEVRETTESEAAADMSGLLEGPGVSCILI